MSLDALLQVHQNIYDYMDGIKNHPISRTIALAKTQSLHSDIENFNKKIGNKQIADLFSSMSSLLKKTEHELKNNASKKEVLASLDDMEKYLLKINTRMDSLSHRELTYGIKQSYASNEDKEAELLFKERLIFHEMKQYVKLLPARMNRDFSLLKLPVVPKFKDLTVTKPKILKTIGLPFQEISGYYILLDQNILVVNKNMAEKFSTEAYKNMPKSSRLKPAEKKTSKFHLPYVKHILELINSRTSDNYILMSDKLISHITHEASPNVELAWIMSSRTLMVWKKILLGKNLIVSNWDFPWNAKDFIK